MPEERARLEIKIVFWSAVVLAVILGAGLKGVDLLTRQWDPEMESARHVCVGYACLFPFAALPICSWAFKKGLEVG